MTFESWAAFTAASAVLLIIPGPTVLLVVSYALGQGWRTVLPMTGGRRAGRLHRHDAVHAGPGRPARYLRHAVHDPEVGGCRLPCLSRHKAVARQRDLGRGATHRRGVGRQDAGPRLAGDGAQSQEHHLLRGLPAGLPRSKGRLPHPDDGVRDDVPGAGLRQCLRLRAGRRPRPRLRRQSAAIAGPQGAVG